MLTIRLCRESNAAQVGRLIADTYSRFNLSFAQVNAVGRTMPYDGG